MLDMKRRNIPENRGGGQFFPHHGLLVRTGKKPIFQGAGTAGRPDREIRLVCLHLPGVSGRLWNSGQESRGPGR